MIGPQTAAVIAALRARSGFSADAVAPDRVASFLTLRMRELGIASVEDAASRALADPAEFARLEAHFAPPETWLFRYPESFEFLRSFARTRSTRGVRALVVGAGGWCEPCSIAAALRDGVGDAQADRVVIEAGDRNAAVFARAPQFGAMELRTGIPPFAARFFVSDGGSVRPTPELLRVIRARAISAEAQVEACRRAGERFDVIAFRNVAIYLEHAARNAIFKALAELLADDGVLLVGHAETTAAASATGLVPEQTAGAFALVRASAAAHATAPAQAEVAPRVRRPRDPWRVEPSAPAAPIVPELDDEAQARAAIAARPSEPRLYLELACILDARGDQDGAREAIGRALYLDRNLEDAVVMAARLAAARGDTAEADHLRARALRIHLDRMRAEGGA
ncbi:MAG: hypothetical protein RLY21_1769 [Planctomycetota bacterium]